MPRFAEPLRVSLVLAACTTADVELALVWLVRWNRAFLRVNPDTPGIYESGVGYARESELWRRRGEERFVSIPYCLVSGVVDCDDAVAWRCAELQEREQVDARPIVRQTGADLYHCLVRYPDGREEDPSARLGMTGWE